MKIPGTCCLLALLTFTLFSCTKKGSVTPVITHAKDTTKPAPVVQQSTYPISYQFSGQLISTFVTGGCPSDSFGTNENSFSVIASYENADSIVFWCLNGYSFSNDNNPNNTFYIYAASSVNPGNTYVYNNYHFTLTKDSLYIKWNYIGYLYYEDGNFSGSYAGKMIQKHQ